MTDQRAFTVRIPEDQAEELEAIAASDGASLAEEVRIAIAERIEQKRRDPSFQAWLRDHMARNRRIMARLAAKKTATEAASPAAPESGTDAGSAAVEDGVAEAGEALGHEPDVEPALVVRHVQRRAEEG